MSPRFGGIPIQEPQRPQSTQLHRNRPRQIIRSQIQQPQQPQITQLRRNRPRQIIAAQTQRLQRTQITQRRRHAAHQTRMRQMQRRHPTREHLHTKPVTQRSTPCTGPAGTANTPATNAADITPANHRRAHTARPLRLSRILRIAPTPNRTRQRSQPHQAPSRLSGSLYRLADRTLRWLMGWGPALARCATGSAGSASSCWRPSRRPRCSSSQTSTQASDRADV